MSVYRLVIHRHGKLLGHFESGTPWAEQAIMEVAALFPDAAGFQLSAQKSIEERRLLASGPEGVQIIHAEHTFTPLELAAGSPT
ncbi:cytoplasmic protein [Pokkaliibacter sp. MBI-7]|uniref:cytoplasmic protein n=1 Tax=Pokkaliibacter sp. MBI-7 TaxID=3040600 RepID=UPI00244842D7|nr:cytoplasmic protein [Pokkaliibacter sp. MBI-7]MDH2433957.1 cytoplasmic protein [Pokkaliibacter sp. MBI-7]